MIAEIISVGTELLMGEILNTDAQYLAICLSEMGINMYHQSTVGDNQKRLVEAISMAMDRSDIVILSGGLGPTADDLTKLAVAEYLGVEMIIDEKAKQDLENLFEQRNYTMSPNNYRQVEFPEGANILPNSVGTAPGCICEKEGKAIIVLPGPPFELKKMFSASVMPYLEKKCDRKLESRRLRIFGIGESMVEHKLRDIIDAQTNPTIAPYADFIGVSLRVAAQTSLDEDPQKLIEPVVERICERLGDAVYSTNNEGLQEVCAKLLLDNNMTLAVAESLTGGAVATELTTVPGISKCFIEGAVTYCNEAKVRLGVPKEMIEKHTAVSAEVAIEMARAIRERAKSDWGISTTGVAGPGPDQAGNPEGLYFVAVSGPDGDTIFENSAGSSGRSRICRSATLTALNELRKRLELLQN